MAVTAGLDSAVDDAVNKQSPGARVLRFLPLGFMATIVFLTYAAIVWTLRRGFDWTDEAFVYTMIASNRMAVGEAWGFQHLLHPLYVLTGESVVVFRIVRLVAYVLLSVALVWCARAVVRLIGMSITRSGWAFVLLLAQVGTFFAWSYPPRYIGYNELASWFAQLGVALILLSIASGVSASRGQRASRALWAVWAALGALTILLVFAKVTSAVAFGGVLAFALFLPNPGLGLWKRIVSVGAGATAVLLVLWAGRAPILFYFQNARSLLFDTSVRDAFGHPTSGMISTYADSLRVTGRALLPAILLFLLAMATFRRKSGRNGDGPGRGVKDVIAWVLGISLLIALVTLPRMIAPTALTRFQFWSYLGVVIAFMGVAGVIGLMILGTNEATMLGSVKSRSFSVAIGGFAILATPFISALGTSNSIMAASVWAATLWAVVLGIALVLLAQRAALLRSTAWSLPSLIGCLIILMAAWAVKADIAEPYRSAPLLSQETPTSVPELRGLLLTQADAAWIDWVSAAGDSLGAANVPAIAINTRVGGEFNSSGALYAFDGSGYANPWLGRDWPAAFNSLRVACKKDPPSDLFVLQPGTATKRASSTIGVTKSLAACGINFPGDFRVVAHRASADPAFAISIWRLKTGGLAVRGNG